MKSLKRFMLLIALLTLGMGSLFMTAEPVSAADPLVLTVSTWSGATSPWTKSWSWTFNKVEELSKGRIKFKWYYSGTLVPARETIPALKSGIADISSTGASLHPGLIPLATVTTLPLLQKWFFMTAMAARELFLDVPEVKAELDKYNIRYLCHAQNPSYGLWTNFPVRSIADIKGRKIMASGSNANLIRALGGSPLTVTPAEVYTALERKTIDGAMGSPSYAMNYKWQEVCRYYYSYPFGCGLPFMAINKDSWKKIPPDIQKMFGDLQEEAVKVAYEIYTGAGRRMLKEGKASGKITITTPSTADAAFIQNVVKDTVWKEWVNSMNKKGLPGQKVLDTYSKFLAKWEKRDPFKD